MGQTTNNQQPSLVPYAFGSATLGTQLQHPPSDLINVHKDRHLGINLHHRINLAQMDMISTSKGLDLRKGLDPNVFKVTWRVFFNFCGDFPCFFVNLTVTCRCKV